MKTLEEALPLGIPKPLSLVESETGLARSSILVKGVHYRAANDMVARGDMAHKGFVPMPANPPPGEARHTD
jgi:hypothetical protein